MITDHKNIWIETGYKLFASSGLQGIKVEPLAKKVGISKSSFYHHFADMDIFIDYLLKHHLTQAYLLAEKEKACNTINPELINVLLAHKTDLFFNRQLRVHRDKEVFNKTLIQANQAVGYYFVDVWVKTLNLKINQQQLEGIFELAIENFYLQITPETLTFEWLAAYFNNLNRIIINFN